MIVGIILVSITAAFGVVIFVLRATKKAEAQRYYDAAYKAIKEECLDEAIRNEQLMQRNRQKLMVYLKWKDDEKQGFVFDPEKPIHIGRNSEGNDICIREDGVSWNHCMLFLYQNELYVQDLKSRNGTYIGRGIRKHRIREVEAIYSGDKLIVGNLSIYVTLFVFDMAYI